MKRNIQGLITTQYALIWLEQSHKIRFLHIFEHVCNVVNQDGGVLSLVTAVIGPGPFFVVLDNYHHNFFDLQTPITINKRCQTLVIGNTEIDCSQATIWQPTPDWPKLRSLQLSALPVPQTFSPDIENQLMNLCAGIATADSQKIRAGAYGLAGRGSGLTPTGDDILIGVIYALWVWQPDVAWIELICDTAVTRTTTLSTAFLKAAASGEATIHWHDFVNGNPNAIQNILNIGHTSGADALAGFTRLCQIFTR